MTTSTTRTIEDRFNGVRRQLQSLCRAIGQEDPIELQRIATLRFELDDLLLFAVHDMRDNGHNDGQIADALGITRQAVSKRWPGGGRYVGAAGRYRSTRSDADDAA